jgi:uncharacterized Zn finger protein
MYYNYYPEYVSVAEKRATAQKALAKLRKSDPDINPVVIEGRKIAKTWWGKEWIENLEYYADYSNRIGRGRSYVANGMVLDLKILPGCVKSYVAGSGSKPYRIEINIKPLPASTWKSITDACNRKISSIDELAGGKFPESMASLFTQKAGGLFPSPREISFSCSCPDVAYMCKHVAATLYAVGAMLDKDPTLFFKLRSVDFQELMKKSVESKISNMLKNTNNRTERTLDEKDISEIFGI